MWSPRRISHFFCLCHAAFLFHGFCPFSAMVSCRSHLLLLAVHTCCFLSFHFVVSYCSLLLFLTLSSHGCLPLPLTDAFHSLLWIQIMPMNNAQPCAFLKLNLCFIKYNLYLYKFKFNFIKHNLYFNEIVIYSLYMPCMMMVQWQPPQSVSAYFYG